MPTLGGLLLVVGAVIAVLDLVGVRFVPSQVVVGIILAVLGLVLILLGRRGRHLEAETVTETRAEDERATRATTVEREIVPPPDRAMSSPVGYGPPAESGAAPGTATASAPGEATAEADPRQTPAAGTDVRRDATVDRDERT